MRCYYCDGHTDHTEYLDNKKIPVCGRMECRHSFYEEQQDKKKRDEAYDNWRLRSE